MKKLLVIPCLMAMMFFTSIAALATSGSIESTNEILHNETETFKVYGNCGMCKNRIESSLKDVKGVSKAKWDVKTKMITVTYDPHVITLDKIKETIASVGHDADGVKANNQVYEGLPSCCQYERAK